MERKKKGIIHKLAKACMALHGRLLGFWPGLQASERMRGASDLPPAQAGLRHLRLQGQGDQAASLQLTSLGKKGRL